MRLPRVLLSITVALGTLTSAPAALAYRPFDGTDADVAALGDFELELGPVHWYSQSDAHYLLAPATVLNLGYAPGWELVADFQNSIGIDMPPGQARDRLLDTDILTKGVLVPGVLQGRGPWPSVAAEVGPLLPNISGEEGFGFSLDVIVSERVSWMTVHVNNWFELSRGDLNAVWFEGVILEGAFRAPMRPVTELYVEHEFVTNLTTWSALVGGIWREGEDLDLDVGLRQASVAGERATEVRLGLTWTLGLWGGKKEEQGRYGRPGVALRR
jgi:hypothetical protein